MSGPASPGAIEFCRRVLALDQHINPRLRSARLTRLDFDLLLDLYTTEQDGGSACLWDVCQAASAPYSTAHRHLTVLIKRGLLARAGDDRDWRRILVQCTGAAKALIETLASSANVTWAARTGSDLAGAHRLSRPIDPDSGR